MKTIKISIKKIEVDSQSFSFNFCVLINGKVLIKDSYNSTHCWNSRYKQKKFKKILKDHYAYDIVLENLGSIKSISNS